MHIRIKIIERSLGDHSRVYDVQIGNQTLTMFDQRNAYAFAEALCAAISLHSLDTAELTEVIGL